MIPSVIGCLGGGMKQLKSDLKELFDNGKELDKAVYEMQITVLWESKSIMKSIVRNVVHIRCYTSILVDKIWQLMSYP